MPFLFIYLSFIFLKKYFVFISFPQLSLSHLNYLISIAIPAQSRLMENLLKCCIVHLFDSVVVMLLKSQLAQEL